jgi:hypothetical protein
MRLEVPGPDFEALARFPLILREASAAAHRIELDFSSVHFVTPAWLAVVGGTLRRLKDERPDTHRRALSFRQLEYAAHMGFFRYFGVEFGREPAEDRRHI